MLKPDPSLDLSAIHKGYSYQVDALEAIKGLPYSAIFHEQGLGKTKIGIDLSLYWLSENIIDTVLVVTKRSLVENWKNEFASHSHLIPHILGGNREENFFVFNSAARIILMHYEVFRTEFNRLEVFLRTRRVGAILDESQKIKNPISALSKAAHGLRLGFTRRVIMTGTPVANRPEDIWSQIYFLDSGESLGRDFDEFRRDIQLGNDLFQDADKQLRLAKGLGDVFPKIESFSVRETKDTAGIELPDKIVKNVQVRMAEKQSEIYNEYRNHARGEIVKNGRAVVDNAEVVLKKLLRLLQVASNPYILDSSYSETPGKFIELESILQSALVDGGKAIVWSSFIENVDWIGRKLANHGSVMVHGAIDIAERNRSVHEFKNNSEIRVLVATPGAAKEGLTLTEANHAIFFDRSFSLDDYLQAQDRIHRISQEQKCYVWNLMSEGTVDSWVDSLLSAKRAAAQLVQSDISTSEYERIASFDFGRTVTEVLNPTEEGGR